MLVGILTYLAAIGLLAYDILPDGVFLLNCKEDLTDTDAISFLTREAHAQHELL